MRVVLYAGGYGFTQRLLHSGFGGELIMKGSKLQKILDNLPKGYTLILPPITVYLEKPIILKDNQLLGYSATEVVLLDVPL